MVCGLLRRGSPPARKLFVPEDFLFLPISLRFYSMKASIAMSTQLPPLHHTITTRLHDSEQDAWEFVCPTCGYRARYFVPNGDSPPYLKVISPGNPKARHTSNCSRSTSVKSQPRVIENHIENDDDVRDTPQMRQQIEELLKDVDMGDFGLRPH